MNGNKRLNENGFLLLEAVVSWLILITCLLIYLPFLTQMWKTVHLERNATEQARIGLEQVQRLVENEPTDGVWTTGGKTYKISITNDQRGVRIHDETQEWTVQMQSFSTSTVEP